MKISSIENGKRITRSLNEAIKHTLTREPANIAVNKLALWRAGARGDNAATLDFWLNKAMTRAKELGLTI